MEVSEEPRGCALGSALTCATACAGVFKLSSGSRELLPPVAAGGAPRLRVAYMSSDFGGHTVGSLIRNLLKLHNRNRCEVCGVGMMKGDGTEWNLEMQVIS